MQYPIWDVEVSDSGEDEFIRFGNIDVPRRLVEARRSSRLVVFAGAGVSRPAGLKSFKGISDHIERETRIDRREASIEQYLGRLESQGVPVHRLTRNILTEETPPPTDLHFSLLRLFGDPTNVRIVTTNYDLLFSDAAEEIGWKIPLYEAPALPQGNQFTGLVHLHGSFRQPDDRLVLTDKDFSEAYLTEGWARRFLQQLFSEYVVLFVGYSHGDDIMRYLARGIPADASGRRYAFDRGWVNGGEEIDRASFWDFHGVEAALYKEGRDDKHEELPKALQKWVEFANERPSDRERRVQDLVSQNPDSLSQKGEVYLREMLRTAEGTRYFTRHAKTYEWVKWSDNRNTLDPLFDQGDLDDREEELVVWIADFIADRSEEVLSLVSNKWTGINQNLTRQIGHRLYINRKHGDIAEQTLIKWILLVTDETRRLPGFIVQLFRECMYPDDARILEVLMQRATELVVNVFEFPNPDMDGNGVGTYSSLEFRGGAAVGLKHTIDEVWRAAYKPNLSDLHSTAGPLITSRLLEASSIYRATGSRIDRYADPISRRWRDPTDRSQIEDVDTIVCMAFDLLDYLLEERPQEALALLSQWRKTDAPILNLLAIYGLDKSDVVEPDEKVKLVLENEWLLDAGLHPRSSRLVASAWAGAKQSTRQDLAQYLLNHLSLDEARERETHWFQIRNLIETLEEIDDANPSLLPVKRELADIRDAVEETPVNSPEETEEITDFSDLDLHTDFRFISMRFADLEDWWKKREAEEDIENETRKNPDWTLRLAEKLAAEERWDDSIWEYMITAWRRVDQPVEIRSQVLSLLHTHSPLHEQYAPQIARLLKSNADDNLRNKCVTDAISLAEDIWDIVASNSLSDEKSLTFSERLKRHPMSDLVEFYTEVYLRGGDGYVPSEFRNKMEGLTRIPTDAAQAGIYELMAWATWIHVNDPSWSRTFVTKLLSWQNESFSAAAWNGILESSGLGVDLIVDLADEFKSTFRFLGALDENATERLIKKIAQASFQRHIDPLHDGWIDSFLKETDEKGAQKFARQIRTLLYESDVDRIEHAWDGWVKQYVERRRDSIPTSLSDGERKEIVRWFSQLGSSFPEAVDLFASQLGPEVSLDSPFEVLHELNQNGGVEEHPSATCDFLNHLLTDRLSVPRMHRADIASLVKKIAATRRDADTIEEVVEHTIRLGCVTAEQKSQWISR